MATEPQTAESVEQLARDYFARVADRDPDGMMEFGVPGKGADIHGLAKLVGDVDRWWAIVDAKLAWASALLAGKAGTADLLPAVLPQVAPRLAAAAPLLNTSPSRNSAMFFCATRASGGG